VLGRAVFGPLCVPFDLIAWGALMADRRSKNWQRQFQGLPHKITTVHWNGALRDVVNAFAGAVLGLSLTNFFTENGPSGLHVALFYVALIAIFAFHLYELSQRRSAQTGSWEPGVLPQDALQTLHEEWSFRKRPGVAWPLAALVGNCLDPSYTRAWKASHLQVVVTSLLLPVVLFIWALLAGGDFRYGRLVVALMALAAISYSSNSLALWLTMQNAVLDTRRFHGRHVRLAQDIAAQKAIEHRAFLKREQLALKEQRHRDETAHTLERLTVLLETISRHQSRCRFLKHLRMPFTQH
jgi:hypothetical protein